jgi:NADH dehydrogenase
VVRKDGPTNLPADRVVQGDIDSDEVANAIKAGTLLFALAGALRPVGGNTYHQANLRSASSAAAAVRNSAVRRILFLSSVGADPNSPNDYLRAKGKAEQILRSCGRESIVFRCTHIIGTPEEPGPLAKSLLRKRGRAHIIGEGKCTVQPVLRDDVVEVLLRAAFAPTVPPPGVFDLAGPERVTLRELAGIINRDPNVPVKTWATWLLALFGKVNPAFSTTMIQVMTCDNVGDARAVEQALGFKLHSVREAWAAAAQPVGAR